MPTALLTAGLSSQPRQGVGARLLRRLGGAVRSAIVGGITLAGALRRPAAARTSPAAQGPEASVPGRLRVPHRPHTALPPRSLLPRLLAGLLSRRHRDSASIGSPAFLSQGDAPFTPEQWPQLSAKACAILNTPLEECDPATLELLFSTLAQHLSEVMSPEATSADREARLPNLWARLSAALGDAEADTALPAPPDAEQLPATGAARPSAKAAPRLSPAPLSSQPASDQAADVAITAAASETTPHIAVPCAPVVHGSRPLAGPGRSFRNHVQFLTRRRPVRHCRALFARGVRDGLPCLPPPWRLYHAACTGPP